MNWYDAAWTKVKLLTIDGSLIGNGVSGAVSYSRVLVSITDAAIAAGAQAAGQDIIFTADDGTTKLAHDLVSYDNGTGTIVAWVLVPAMTAGTTYYLPLYYKNGVCAAQQNKSGTWATAPTYPATVVLHFEGGVTDSSGNGNNGTDFGTASDAGQVGLARAFDGVDDYVTMAAAGFYAIQTEQYVSVGAWIKATSGSTGRQTIIVKGNAGSEVLSLYLDDTGAICFEDYYATDWLYYAVGDVDLRDDAWHRVWGVRNGAAMKVYVDGVDATILSTGGVETIVRTEDVYVGGRLNSDFFFVGDIDELVVLEGALTEGEITTDFNASDDPASFITVGAEMTFVDAFHVMPVSVIGSVAPTSVSANRVAPVVILQGVQNPITMPVSLGTITAVSGSQTMPTSILQGVLNAPVMPMSLVREIVEVVTPPISTGQGIEKLEPMPVSIEGGVPAMKIMPTSIHQEIEAEMVIPDSIAAEIEADRTMPTSWLQDVMIENVLPIATAHGLAVGRVMAISIMGPVSRAVVMPFNAMRGMQNQIILPASVKGWIRASRVLAITTLQGVEKTHVVPIQTQTGVIQSVTGPISLLSVAGLTVAAPVALMSGIQASRELPTNVGAFIASQATIPASVMEGIVQSLDIPMSGAGAVALIMTVPVSVFQGIQRGQTMPTSIGKVLAPTPVAATQTMPVVILQGVSKDADLNIVALQAIHALQAMPVSWWTQVQHKIVQGQYVLLNMTPEYKIEPANDQDAFNRTADKAVAR